MTDQLHVRTPRNQWPPSVSSSDGKHELMRLLKKWDSGDSIAGEIAVSVATDIIEGRLLPGDDVNSVELARTFHSSRTPVREALLVLEREGFVEIPARRRPRVAHHSLQEIRELYHLRGELYSLVSRAVVERATDEDLDNLRQIQSSLEAATARGDVDQYVWANVQFRNTEAAIAADDTLCRTLDTLALRALQLRHLSLSQPGRLAKSVADHARLLEAYEERDPILASALTRSLVLRGLAAVERSGWTGAASTETAIRPAPAPPSSPVSRHEG